MGNAIGRRRLAKLQARQLEEHRYYHVKPEMDQVKPITAGEIKYTTEHLREEGKELLLNVNTLQGVNIFTTRPREQVGAFDCIKIPQGTWIYKAVPKERGKHFVFRKTEWFGNLVVAEMYRASGVRDSVIAMQFREDVYLIDLNIRRNVLEIIRLVESRGVSSDTVKAIKTATGVEASTWSQLKAAFAEKPLSTLFRLRIGPYLLGNRRLSTMDGDAKMMDNGLCPLLGALREEKDAPEVPIAGYIAASVPSALTDTMHEELAICNAFKNKLSEPYLLLKSEARTLMATGQLIPSTNLALLRDRVRLYWPLAVIGPVLMAYMQYRNSKLAKSHRALFDQEVANLKAECEQAETKTKPEIVRALFRVSAYHLPSSAVFNPKTGGELNKTQLCNAKVLFPFTTNRALDTFNIFSSIGLASIWPFLMAKLFQTRHAQKMAQIKSLQERMAKDEVLPLLENVSAWESKVLTVFMNGSDDWKRGIFPDLKAFRARVVRENPDILALSFVRPNGELRTTTEEAVRAALLYALRDLRSFYTALGVVTPAQIGESKALASVLGAAGLSGDVGDAGLVEKAGSLLAQGAKALSGPTTVDQAETGLTEAPVDLVEVDEVPADVEKIPVEPVEVLEVPADGEEIPVEPVEALEVPADVEEIPVNPIEVLEVPADVEVIPTTPSTYSRSRPSRGSVLSAPGPQA